MTFVDFTPEDIDAVQEARRALMLMLDPDNAFLLDELLGRMRLARNDEIAAAVVAELTERRGLLRVVN